MNWQSGTNVAADVRRRTGILVRRPARSLASPPPLTGDLFPNRGGYKSPPLIRKHRSKLHRLAAVHLDDDLRFASAIPVAIAPLSIINAHQLDRVGIEAAVENEPGRARENGAFSPPH